MCICIEISSTEHGRTYFLIECVRLCCKSKNPSNHLFYLGFKVPSDVSHVILFASRATWAICFKISPSLNYHHDSKWKTETIFIAARLF